MDFAKFHNSFYKNQKRGEYIIYDTAKDNRNNKSVISAHETQDTTQSWFELLEHAKEHLGTKLIFYVFMYLSIPNKLVLGYNSQTDIMGLIVFFAEKKPWRNGPKAMLCNLFGTLGRIF
jgi:hypothetical protein